MGIIQFKEANCKNCYKCIRNCSVKAIRFSNEQANILENECILCGTCCLVCPQNAKQIKSDLSEVQKYIDSGVKVYASIAPSYVSAFPGVSFAVFSAALKKLGFARVEETAIGAAQVSKEYARLMQEEKMKNIITTCCPTTVLLVEKYYPELVGCLAPVVSPATAHAKMMKEIYGPKIKVVFIGPCISKKYEAAMNLNINAVLMFEEVARWLREKGISFDAPDPEPSEMHATINRLYPVPGGIVRTIPASQRKNYKCVAIDGLDRCREALESLRKHQVTGYFIEMSACAGSCVSGPGMKDFDTSFLFAKDHVLEQAKKRTQTPVPITENAEVDFSISYRHIPLEDKLPDEETIRGILADIGKTSEEQMLNCGACGYSTCRDKAIAVYQGKADLHMCLPYMRERAESMSNLILDNTPNGLIMIDAELNVLEYNRSASAMFHMNETNYVGLPIELLLSDVDFQTVRATGAAVHNTRYTLDDGRLTVEQSVVPIKNGDFLAILRDVTAEEKGRREIEKMRAETVETAQNVIDKQMRVAQEIASLLGETTGETKAALTNLKKSIAREEAL